MIETDPGGVSPPWWSRPAPEACSLHRRAKERLARHYPTTEQLDAALVEGRRLRTKLEPAIAEMQRWPR